MKKIHLILQGKGGVGKSLIASLLMQYLQKKSYNVIAIDTDPVNSTLHGYSKLNIQLLGLCARGGSPRPGGRGRRSPRCPSTSGSAPGRPRR